MIFGRLKEMTIPKKLTLNEIKALKRIDRITDIILFGTIFIIAYMFLK